MGEPFNRQEDGTVVNSNLKLGQYSNNPKNESYTIQKAMILEVYHKDHPKNKFKRGVEYRAVIVGGPREGELLHNVTPLDGFGGGGNFHEVVYTPKTEVIRGKNKGDATPPENTDGSHVIVGFLGGHQNHPIILGGWPQPNNAAYGASAEDGTLMNGSFNGLGYSINKDGVLKFTRKGTTIIVDSESGGISIESDKEITINSDEDIVINSAKNINVTANEIVNITGPSVNINSSTSVNIAGAGSINIGEGASEAMVKGDALTTLFNLHTHSASGEGPPNEQMTASQLSDTVKVS